MYFVKKARRSVPSQWCHSGDATSKRERERERAREMKESQRKKEQQEGTHVARREIKKECRNVPSQWYHNGDAPSNREREREKERKREERER